MNWSKSAMAMRGSASPMHILHQRRLLALEANMPTADEDETVAEKPKAEKPRGKKRAPIPDWMARHPVNVDRPRTEHDIEFEDLMDPVGKESAEQHEE